MATPDVTAGTIFTSARALLNDQNNETYSNAVLLPYLQTAFRELRESFQQSNIPVTNVVDDILSVPALTTRIGFDTVPALPEDLVEIRAAWYQIGTTYPWYPFTRREFIPPQLEGIDYSEPIYWAWLNNSMHLLPSNQILSIKLQYIKQQTEPADENSNIQTINGQSFLEYRTAALAARFAMENIERANDLDTNAGLALDRAVSVENKAKQAIYTRRRPFRQNWKNRTPF